MYERCFQDEQRGEKKVHKNSRSKVGKSRISLGEAEDFNSFRVLLSSSLLNVVFPLFSLPLPPLLNLCDRASVLMVHVDCRQHTAAASAAVWLRFRERLSLVEVRMTFFIPLMSFEV